MRIGTWNLEGRWTERHRAFLAELECDVLLLTEVRSDTAIDGLALHPSSEMVGGRWWAAVASWQDLQPLAAPHPASAAAEIAGWLRVCCSVLPWKGCGPWWPWHDGSTAEKTAQALVGIDRSSPQVWGGDWNHSLSGQEWAGAKAGRAFILDAVAALELRVPTASLPHRLDGVLSIDHIAVPTSWEVSSATRVGATGLSDHDAYVVETTPVRVGPTS